MEKDSSEGLSVVASDLIRHMINPQLAHYPAGDTQLTAVAWVRAK